MAAFHGEKAEVTANGLVASGGSAPCSLRGWVPWNGTQREREGISRRYRNDCSPTGFVPGDDPSTGLPKSERRSSAPRSSGCARPCRRSAAQASSPAQCASGARPCIACLHAPTDSRRQWYNVQSETIACRAIGALGSSLLHRRGTDCGRWSAVDVNFLPISARRVRRKQGHSRERN